MKFFEGPSTRLGPSMCDAILLAVDPKKADELLRDIDDEYEGRHTDARFVRMLENGYSQASAHKAVDSKG